jgi:type I restriction enzyme S subunit
MSFAGYSDYSAKEIPWVDQLPKHWRVQPLLGLARERNEDNFGMKEDNLLSLSYGRIVEKDMSSNDGLLPESFETYQIVHPSDIVFRLTDLQNDKRSLRTGLVTKKGIITSAYVAVCPTNIHAVFFAYLLRAYDLMKVFYSMGGGLRQSMKFSDIKRLPIPVPSLAEQEAIAAFLDRETGKIDALVEEQKRLIALLKEKRQAVISHAVTKGLNPDAPKKDSGVEWLGAVPSHWQVVPMRYVATIGNGSTPNRENVEYWDGGTYPWLNSSVVNRPFVDNAEQFITKLALKECHLPIIEPPAILVGITGQGRTRGMATVLLMEATINQHVAYIKPLDDRVTCSFLLRFFETAYEHLRAESEAGSTKGAITCEQLSRLKVPLPPPAEQGAICHALEHNVVHSDALISEAELAVQLLQERRSALISAAVTGKIDVRGLVPDQAEAA